MKKNFLMLGIICASLSFVSCSKDDTSEPVPTDCYMVEDSNSDFVSTSSTVKSSLMAFYKQKMDEIGTYYEGYGYVTTLKENEVVAAFEKIEPQAEAILNQFYWEGKIGIALAHYQSDGSASTPYEKYFTKTDPTIYPLPIKTEVIDSLCYDLTPQQLTSFKTLFNNSENINVVGIYKLSNFFRNALDSLRVLMEEQTKDFSNNQLLVIKYQQSATALTKSYTCFLYASRDSIGDQPYVDYIKTAIQPVYKFDYLSSDAMRDLWHDYYYPYIDVHCNGGYGEYKLKEYNPNVAQNDSIMNAMLVNLESGAVGYLSKLTYKWTEATITVDRKSFFGNKKDFYKKTFTPSK